MMAPRTVSRSSSSPDRPALALLAALALSACALDDVGDSVVDTRAAVIGDVEAPTPEEEFPEMRTNCRLPGAELTRYGTGWRLGLPHEIYAARNSESVAIRIACLADWARGRGLAVTVAEVR
ncbi:MAG TPA: hypothetical protein VFQ67_06515 [Allosphingosinicella sp.]|jgi:hypothetical protein|nr:hypothetical protein [Allosphingosinicella sp.]